MTNMYHDSNNIIPVQIKIPNLFRNSDLQDNESAGSQGQNSASSRFQEKFTVYKVNINSNVDKGKDISNQLYTYLKIPEEDKPFFGIAIPPIPVENHKHIKWLRDEKLLRKQVSNCPSNAAGNDSIYGQTSGLRPPSANYGSHSGSNFQNSSIPQLELALKIFPTNNLLPKSLLGKQLACLLIRNMIQANLLLPSLNILIELYALTLQILFGDHTTSNGYYNNYNDHYYKEEIYNILSEIQNISVLTSINYNYKEVIKNIETSHLSLNNLKVEKATHKFFMEAQKIDLYGIHLFEVKPEKFNMNKLKAIDLGVDLQGILFYENRLNSPSSSNLYNSSNNPRNSHHQNQNHRSQSQNSLSFGSSNSNNIVKIIHWRKIQKLKYRDKLFLIEHIRSVNSSGDKKSKQEEVISDSYKLNNFRLCKDLYFTCIYHHEMFKRILSNRGAMLSQMENQSFHWREVFELDFLIF